MKIHELLTDEHRWTQRADSRDPKGEPCLVHAPEAMCWCLIGTVYKCYPQSGADRLIIILKVEKHIGIADIVKWNDSHTFEEVRALCLELNI